MYRGKLKSDDVAVIADAYNAILSGLTTEREDYARAGLSEKRFRWDVFWAARSRNVDAFNAVMDRIYTYADDTHLDTLLRHLAGH